jgi:hypothetical protein
MERGALSTSLSVLLVLFIIQFFTGMAMNLLVTLSTNLFPSSGGSLAATFTYILTGGNILLSTHFIIDIIIIAVGAVNLALTIHQRNVYKALSLISLILVLSAFINGERFVASNFAINGISFGMAAAFLVAFILYFTMAMLMYREIAVKTNP